MKAGLVINGPDVEYGPLALLSGTSEEKLSKAAGLGYHGIELMVRDPAKLDWEAMRTALGKAKLEVSQVVTGELFGADGLCLVTSDSGTYRRAEVRTHAVIDLAQFLGAMVNIGRLRGQLRFLEGVGHPWETAVQRLRGVALYAAERGVRIAIEPLNRYETDFILNVDDGLRMARDIDSGNVGLMLDLFHMNIEEASIQDALRAAGERLWHVHIADSNRCYPGSGHLDFAGIFGTLREMGYEGYVSAEVLPLPDPDTAAMRTIEFLNRWIPGEKEAR